MQRVRLPRGLLWIMSLDGRFRINLPSEQGEVPETCFGPAITFLMTSHFRIIIFHGDEVEIDQTFSPSNLSDCSCGYRLCEP